MYNVMLVDDDYPVIELLSEAIDWERLGLRLMGCYENGASAWEHSERELPDILITDIGMPKMDGLELSARVKERKPGVRIVILSCHDEFSYARQAMRLNVQEYLLKESLDPEDLVVLLKQFKESLDEERQWDGEQARLHALENNTKELRKEQILKNLIHQPLLSPLKWLQEVSAFGLLLQGEYCIPAVGHLDEYRKVKHRFASDQTLRFAVANVMNEVLNEVTIHGLHVCYNERKQLLLFTYKPSLKTNIYDLVVTSLYKVQATLLKVLKVRMTFRIGKGCGSPESLKENLYQLVSNEEQRFYLEQGEIVKEQAIPLSSQNLFSEYDAARSELRDALLAKRTQEIGEVASTWIMRIKGEKYPPAMVKDWVLKLLLDLKLQQNSMHLAGTTQSAETLSKDIADIDSFAELQEWLSTYLQTVSSGTEVAAGSKRPEMKEAYKYVSLNLHRRISLEEVAEHLHLNASYFSRLFKKEMGITFIEHVTHMKMERAKELLDQTPHTVGAICEQLGYDNQSYFIKTFKAHTGVTPVEYRG
ncbi:AraC family transcriptional regulator [Cohnella sp.]|uniref:response regulator transcription factor n=1 Tax=Cohnella sp. TaxID=1883426 RepID=UPI003569399C